MHTLLDGKAVSEKIISECAERIKEKKLSPILAVILVGTDKASQIYVKKKEEACARAGIGSIKRALPEDTTEEALLKLINGLNSNPIVTGILVQTPLPKHISGEKISSAISPKKDVDCWTPENMGNLLLGDFSLSPCTPKGILELLGHYQIPLEGKSAVVIGRSNTVGKPTALMLLARNATVTICHSKTQDISMHTRNADIIVVAAGRKGLLKGSMVKEGCVIIDVGINREKGRIYGDAEFDSVSKKSSFITPVPGGVGPMTVACLIQNALNLYEKYHKK